MWPWCWARLTTTSITTNAAQPIIPPDLREKPLRPVNSDVSPHEDLRVNLLRKPISHWVQHQSSSDFEGSLDRIAECVANLPGLDAWKPAADGMDVLSVLLLGATLSRVDQLGCESLLKKIAKSIAAVGRPNPEDSAELNSAALLSLWASNVRSVPTKTGVKTPDFKAEIGGVEVECEVTNSEQKSLQIALKERAIALAQHLQAVLPVAGLRVRFSDEADENDLHNLVVEAATLTPGEIRESNNRWHIQGFDSPVQPDLDAAIPSWWQKQYATPTILQSSFQVSHSSVAQQVDTRPGVEIEVLWCLSTKSYLNSLSKKQSAEQASGSVPFIVLCDVSQLPGAFGWYSENLPPLLKTWSQRLSAVILFRRVIPGLDTLQFKYQIHTNPNASLQVPTALRDPSQGELRIPFNSSGQSAKHAG